MKNEKMAEVFKEFETVVFDGKTYYVLEPMHEIVMPEEYYASVFEEPGWESGGLHVVAADAEPDEQGLYPCMELSYVRKDGGDWLEDGVERMLLSTAPYEIREAFWNPARKTYEAGQLI